MLSTGLPFNPLRDQVYSPEELFDAFQANDPTSYSRSADIAILSYFWGMGANPTRQSGASTLEALHDNSISKAVQNIIATAPKIVAIMGGNGMVRKDDAYANVANIAYELSRKGFLVTSGGGPGAMEATHLGVLFSKRSSDELKAAIELLKSVSALPSNANKLVKNDGSIDGEIAKTLHAWLAPAFTILENFPVEQRGASLGVPTWLCGYEPTTPFATHSAKYFQNSIREDGLVTMGVSGIIYAEGSAGTIQEIFQDAAQNYYDKFYPMVFLSSAAAAGEHYWEKKLPVRPLIQALLGSKPGFKNVLFTDDVHEVITFFP